MTTEKLDKDLKSIKKLRKNSRPKRSRLFKFKADIIYLKNNGASYEDIRLWLRTNKRIKMTARNINYYYKKHCKANDEKS